MILIATDAWYPQVNGVVRALDATRRELIERGWTVKVVSPDQYRTMPCPTYPEIRLALGAGWTVARRLDPILDRLTHVHIATEGPIGKAVRRWCLRRGISFTTSFHTRFPDYVALRTGLSADWFWPIMRRFHGAAARTLAVTPSLAEELVGRGIPNVHIWPLGVDTAMFCPGLAPDPTMAHLPCPIRLYVGRVAVEKNLEELLRLKGAGSTVIVGDGPDRATLEARFPEAHFLGARHGVELAACYAAADVFVFPSLTDTFGLVNIEALASGVPVAAFPVRGPVDILGLKECGIHGGIAPIGALDADLGRAVERALAADRAACVAEASHYDWGRCTDRFLEGLVQARAISRAAA